MSLGYERGVDTVTEPTRPAPIRRRPRPRVHRPNEDRVVMIDIDGVLADLSAHAGVLADEDIDPAQRWREFFAHVPDAAVLAGGHDLAWAVHGLGYTIVYSTTRPAYALAATRQWLPDQDFPEGRAVLGRPASELLPPHTAGLANQTRSRQGSDQPAPGMAARLRRRRPGRCSTPDR
jgi:hypothetical protein